MWKEKTTIGCLVFIYGLKDGFFIIMASSILITTPIFYVNSRPHLGHAFSMLVADAHARWLSKMFNSVKLSTGTDEHGQKVIRNQGTRLMTL